MFVHHRGTFVGGAEVQDVSAVPHGFGEGPFFIRRHVLEEDRHGEGAPLVFGDGPICQAGDEEFDLRFGEDAAVAFAGNEGGDVHEMKKGSTGLRPVRL